MCTNNTSLVLACSWKSDSEEEEEALGEATEEEALIIHGLGIGAF
jgi:hypothetical protein